MIDGKPHVRIDWAGIGERPSTIFGDAVHVLRSSLDLTATEIVRRAGKDATKVSFPFGTSAESLEKEIREKRVHCAGTAACDLVRKHRPYVGGNDLLRAVHDIDIRDKHVELVPFETKRRLRVAAQYNIDNPIAGTCTVHLTDFSFAIPTGMALAGQRAVDVVRSMRAVVVEIVDEFEALAASFSSAPD